eukprot:6915405-Prymnesium_polylepis.1
MGLMLQQTYCDPDNHPGIGLAFFPENRSPAGGSEGQNQHKNQGSNVQQVGEGTVRTRRSGAA